MFLTICKRSPALNFGETLFYIHEAKDYQWKFLFLLHEADFLAWKVSVSKTAASNCPLSPRKLFSTGLGSKQIAHNWPFSTSK